MTTDAERLARLREQRDNAPLRYDDGFALAPMLNFQWIEVDFLLKQLDERDAEIATLRQERDAALQEAKRLWATLDRMSVWDQRQQAVIAEYADRLYRPAAAAEDAARTDRAERPGMKLFIAWLQTRPARTPQPSIMGSESTRLIDMIDEAITAARAEGARQTSEI